MTYKIIDNFLDKDISEQIQRSCLGNNIDAVPWYISRYVAHNNEDFPVGYLYHSFYKDYQPTSPFFNVIALPICQKLNMTALMRVKGNCFPSTSSLQEHDWHKDFEVPHKGAVYYVNSNDGFTILSDGTKVESIENRLLIFNSATPHRSTNCTDEQFRITINLNYM